MAKAAGVDDKTCRSRYGTFDVTNQKPMEASDGSRPLEGEVAGQRSSIART